MNQAHFEFFGKNVNAFGGSLLSGKRKVARPLSTKTPMHLILKSSGSSFFVPGSSLEKLIRNHANKYQIKIHKLALNWSHVHLGISIPSRKHYLAFIRTLTALIVRVVSKAKGKNLKGLFDLRPFTRIITWGREFKSLMDYVELNEMEALGLVNRKKKSLKKPRLKKFSICI